MLLLSTAWQLKLQRVMNHMPGCTPHGCQACVGMPALLQPDALPFKCVGPCCDALHTVFREVQALAYTLQRK